VEIDSIPIVGVKRSGRVYASARSYIALVIRVRHIQRGCAVEILRWIVEYVRQKGMGIKEHKSRVFEPFADQDFVGDLQPEDLVDERSVLPHLVSDCRVVGWLKGFVTI
jgi:hypothetical protein